MKINLWVVLCIFLLSNCRNKPEEVSETEDLIGLPYLGTVMPKSSQDIETNPWGVQAGSNFELAAGIGVKWTRIGMSWPRIEQEKGVYNWSRYDSVFAQALSHGIRPFVTLDGANELYTERIPHDDPAKSEIYGIRPAPPTYNEEAMQAWVQFVETAVQRYKGKITHWEVWNEPNHHAYWGKGPDARDYGKLLQATVQVIKRIDPEAVVIAGATAGIEPEWTEEYLEMGFADQIDVISYHQYGGEPEERLLKTIELKKAIARHNPDIETWQGECGYPSHSSTRDFRGTPPWGLNIQAKWLLRQSFSDVGLCGATLSNYFVLTAYGRNRDQDGNLIRQERSYLTEVDSILGYYARFARVRGVGVNEKCLIDAETGEPKPAYYAYQNLCAVFNGNYKVSDERAAIEVVDPGVFYGIGGIEDAFPSVPLSSIFQKKDGKPMIAYWLPWHGQEYLPEYARVDLKAARQFQDPVLVNLLDGKVYQLEAESDGKVSVFRNVPLADYPMLVMEKEEVGYRD